MESAGNVYMAASAVLERRTTGDSARANPSAFTARLASREALWSSHTHLAITSVGGLGVGMLPVTLKTWTIGLAFTSSKRCDK